LRAGDKYRGEARHDQSNRKLTRGQRLLLYGGLVLFALMHLYYLDAPPNGYHAWRESDTAAIALNYYQEDPNFFHPRVNQRGAHDGITGMELPLYNFATAALYHLVGPRHAAARALTCMISIITLLLMYRLARILTDGTTAVYATWAAAFSSLFLFYSFKIMPDMLMLMFLVAAFYLFLKYIEADRLIFVVSSMVCLILSGAIKPLGLSLLLPMAYLVWSRQRGRPMRFLLYGGYASVSFLAVLAWFLYARWVNQGHGSPGFYLGENLPNFHQFLLTDQFIRKLVFQWPAELWIGWGLIPAFLVGLFVVWKSGLRSLVGWWLLSAYLVFAVTAQHSASHDYYALIIIPLVSIVSGYGVRFLMGAGGWRRGLAIIMIAVTPAAGFVRIMHRFGDTSDFHAIRAAASLQIPREALVIVEEETSAVRLYQMNRHGWPLQDGVTADRVLWRWRAGAEYVVLNHPLERYPDVAAQVEIVREFPLGPLFGYELGERH